jgi:hypothetical protein
MPYAGSLHFTPPHPSVDLRLMLRCPKDFSQNRATA